MNQEENQKNGNQEAINSREKLYVAKTKFSEKALGEVLVFLENDNRMVSAFADIVETLNDEIKRNPGALFTTPQSSQKSSENDQVVGGSFLGDIFGPITEIVTKDKELAAHIIDTIIPW